MTFKGTVSTDSALTECYFEYVDPTAPGIETELVLPAFAFAGVDFSDLSSGGRVDCAEPLGSIPADSSTNPVSVAVPLPAPEYPYYYRLVATNASGSDGE